MIALLSILIFAALLFVGFLAEIIVVKEKKKDKMGGHRNQYNNYDYDNDIY